MAKKKIEKPAPQKTIISPRGGEINDPYPHFLEVTPRRLSMNERIARAVKHEISNKALENGYETLEEANDFDVEDDFNQEEMTSKYQLAEDEFIDHEHVETQKSDSVPDVPQSGTSEAEPKPPKAELDDPPNND